MTDRDTGAPQPIAPEITNLPEFSVNGAVLRAFIAAEDETRKRGLESIATEELLLGALRIFPGSFEMLSLNPYNLRDQVLKVLPEGVATRRTIRNVELTPRGRAAISLAQSEAEHRAGEPIIDEYDYIMGLAREGEGIAAGVLEWYGASPYRLRPKIERIREEITS